MSPLCVVWVRVALFFQIDFGFTSNNGQAKQNRDLSVSLTSGLLQIRNRLAKNVHSIFLYPMLCIKRTDRQGWSKNDHNEYEL